MKENDVVCVIGIVQEDQNKGKVVNLEKCHILAVGDECDTLYAKITEQQNIQDNLLRRKKQKK